MRNHWNRPRRIVWLLFAGLVAAGLTACGRQALPQAASSGQLPPTLTASETALIAPTGSHPVSKRPEQAEPVNWSAAPPCANQPLSFEEWQERLQQSLRASSDPLEMRAEALISLSEAPAAQVGEDPARQSLTALAVNVAAGRLNRATGIQVETLPEIKTVGGLMDAMAEAAAGDTQTAEMVAAAQGVLAGEGLTRPVCARLIVTQFTRPPGQVTWTAQGIRSETAVAETAALLPGERQPVLDTGKAAPNGKRVAYTSFMYETGGPVFVQELENGAWNNLIRAVNEKQSGKVALPEDLGWEVIGWFPDSQRLLIGAAELSSVHVVDLRDFSLRTYGFPGGGQGGGRVVDLAPDGSQFVYAVSAADGSQNLVAVDLTSGQEIVLQNTPAHEGLVLYPRFSPDGSQIAYVSEQGHPLTGVSYVLRLLSPGEKQSQLLVEGNTGATLPVWSPDGRYIAFSRKSTGTPDVIQSEAVPPPPDGNVWVVEVQTGTAQQVTNLQGWARSPAWNSDSQTLAFVTGNGQVGMVRMTQPGQVWLATETNPEMALFTGAFFLP